MWVKAFHVRGVTSDLTAFSPTFTKIVPSRVHVSRIFPSRFSVRASQAMVARDLVMSSLTNRCVPFNFLALRITAVFVLCVVKRTMISRGADRSSVFFPTRWERTTSLVSIFTSSLRAARSLTSRLRQPANPRRVATRVLFQIVAPLLQAHDPHLQVLD